MIMDLLTVCFVSQRYLLVKVFNRELCLKILSAISLKYLFENFVGVFNIRISLKDLKTFSSVRANCNLVKQYCSMSIAYGLKYSSRES